MNVTSFFLQRRTFALVLMVFVSLAGLLSFNSLGRLEDPEFTIKTAVVATRYPGASALEVEQEVTERLEIAIQSMDEVRRLRSISRPEMSMIVVDIQEEVPGEQIPQTWDKLRRKVSDAQGQLPPGVDPSRVNDDWGAVYGIFLTVTGDGYSLQELDGIVKDLRRELLLVDGVGSVATMGEQPEAIYIEMPRSKMSQVGVTPMTLAQTLSGQSAVEPAGQIHTGQRNIRISPTGQADSVTELGQTLVRGRSQGLTRLSDLAQIERGLWDQPPSLVYFDGQPAIALGIATVTGGNVVETGKAVQARLGELEPTMPLGVKLNVVYDQPQVVDAAVSDFVVGLIEAVLIVIGLLLLFMGLRSGLIIGGVLLMTILGSFVFMDMMDINLQRISLGALVIALGMLVDNAIVVVEGVLIKMQRGVSRTQAAIESVAETQWPLLGATFIAILAFAAISQSPDSVGEFLYSLFAVIAISLLLSWVLAVTFTPLLSVMFLKVKPSSKVSQQEDEQECEADQPQDDVYGGWAFGAYRKVLRVMIRHRWLSILATGLIFAGSIYGFGSVEQNFFPNSAQPMMLVNYWKVEGTHIRDTERGVMDLTDFTRSLPEVEHVSTMVGQGALRFMLTYEAELPNTSYGQLIIQASDAEHLDAIAAQLRQHVAKDQPDAQIFVQRFALGPGGGAKIEARFQGPDPEVLRRLSAQTQAIFAADKDATHIRDDWRHRVPVIKPRFSEAQARHAGVSRSDVSQILNLSTSGTPIGLYREDDKLIPIVMRLPEEERTSVDGIMDAQLWSRATGQVLPARALIDGLETGYEDGIIRRYDRQRTLTVQCDPATGQASDLLNRLRPAVEEIELPPGYSLEWGGEYENSTNANERMMANVPLCMALMVLIVIGLFNELRTPMVIFSLLPLALIGVVAGLLLFNQPFGFMATLGVLSLAGMMIKNAIVLVEQIKINDRARMPPLESVIEAGVSRARPVAMAAFTTVLGMIPLVSDAFFGPMAVTIMAGLTVATVLTLLLLPVVYATIYRLRA